MGQYGYAMMTKHYQYTALSGWFPMAVSLKELNTELTNLLQPERFKDYCPNGLQLEGSNTVSKIVSGVTASQALIDAAIQRGADTLLVHHGYFWRGEDQTIVGMKKKRVQSLLSNNINLFAYHLPLDAHLELGNNAQLGKLLNLEWKETIGRPGDLPLVAIGELSEPSDFLQLSGRISDKLNRKVIAVEGRRSVIRRVAWCTGAAQNYFDLAVEAGVDAYITGEISEPSAHIARESGVHFFAAGHHATERYGVQAVGEYLAGKLAIDHEFVDIDNPA